MRRWILLACTLLLTTFVTNASVSPQSSLAAERARMQSALPPGYTIDLFATVQWPAEIQCVADGRCFIASVHDSFDQERSGIYVVTPDKAKRRIYTGPRYDLQHLGEKGLTGMALHPNFVQDDRIFFYWSIPDQNNVGPTRTVISSIRSDGSDYRTLWVFSPPGNEYTNIHVAGGLLTVRQNGRDYLYAAVGNYDHDTWSQDLSIDQGKIHRFEIVGDSLQVPSDNPFVGTPDARPSIWARGFRNPFRMTRDTASGVIYVNENGRSCSDRVYVLVRGGNYGWPSWDDCRLPGGFVLPAYEFVPTMGITDIEVYHGPIPGWDGNIFVCGFNTKPLYMFSNGFANREEVIGGGQNCTLALGTRADGALLYTRQTQFGLEGQVFAVVPLVPGPRIAATLTTDTAGPAAGQRIHYALDVANLAFANTLTATIALPPNLNVIAGSTFGGAILDGAAGRVTWTAELSWNRALRAGFDAVAAAAPGSIISTTARIVDRYGQQTDAAATVTLSSGSPLQFALTASAPSIRSGQTITYLLQAKNRSLVDAAFSLTTTLPAEAQFVRHALTGTTTYDGGRNAVLWLRVLPADRQALAGFVISATQTTRRSIPISTTATFDGGALGFVTQLLVDPYRAYLALIARSGAASSSVDSLTVDDHPFGRYGTPPGSLANPINEGNCQQCHDVEGSSIYAGWSGSAHGYGGIDPVFKAALHNASSQVQDVERWCTQCHQPGHWLEGHPLDAQNTSGVVCTVCHRAVDTDSAAAGDQTAIARAQAMAVVPPRWKELGGNGALIIDPDDVRRGTNFWNNSAPHPTAISVFQGSSALCGACHSVYAPHLAKDSQTGEFTLGAPDLAGGENPLFLQSTYPEWLNSQYAAAGTQCQDCHMPMQPGYVASPDKGGNPRSVPSHTFAGGNLFVLDLFDQTGALGDTRAPRAAVSAMLSQAATLTASVAGPTLTVGVTCLAGHKCPTGYEEGRAWVLQVDQLDAAGKRIACSGCWDESAHTIQGYDAHPGDPDFDPELTVFGVRFGITGAHALQIGRQAGESFSLALNNAVLSDTRIPPCGWDAVKYAELGIAPTVPYPPGGCTALARYAIQPNARLVIVRLLHWSHTTPYLEFLRDAGGEPGASLWSAWQTALATGGGRPAVVTSHAEFIGITPHRLYLPSIRQSP